MGADRLPGHSGAPSHPTPQARYSERVTRALLAVDALYRAESGDADGLVVLNMDTAGVHRPEPWATYEEAGAGWTTLLRDSRELPEPDRRAYYEQLSRSTLAFIAWRTRGLDFEARLRGLLHVPPHPAADDELARLRSTMGDLLARMGYGGDLATRFADWEQDRRVPAADVVSTLQAYLDEARDRTDALLFRIPADRSDGMRAKAVSGVAFNARCDYLNRSVEVNTDPVLTRPGLKHLAVHEGSPGHWVQFRVRESLHRSGEAGADGLLSVVNTASSAVFEGIADAGIGMLDWYEGDDDRLQALLNRYRAGIGTAAAWRLHVLAWPPDRVAAWLRDAGLAGGEGWVANRMRFISAPSRAVLIWSYWWGQPVVESVLDRVPQDRRTEFYRHLYGRMHSVDSVGMFV